MPHLHEFFFAPHGMCLQWNPAIMSLIVTGNLAVFLAYAFIPWEFIRAWRHSSTGALDPHARQFLKNFAWFIFFCGTGHLFKIITLWYGGNWYWVEALWTAFGTAVFSWHAFISVAQRMDLIIPLLQNPVTMSQLQGKLVQVEKELAELRERHGEI